MNYLRKKVPLLLLFVAVASLQAAFGINKFRVLHQFTNGNDGGGPIRFAPLAMGKNGSLYGAAGGGSHRNCEGSGCGVIFRFSPHSNGKWSETVLYNYDVNQYPAQSPLAVDSDSNLYGCSGYGSMFELSPAKGQWTLNSIWSYGCDDPVGLVLDSSSNLYGAFSNGITGGVSELSSGLGGWSYTNLYEFCQQKGCPDGETPLAPLSWDRQGNLYGTDYSGGLVDYGKCGGWCGVAFQMTPNGDGTWAYHVLHRFDSFKGDGCIPYGSLTVDASGTVYGTTTKCGPHTDGTIFKLTKTKSGTWKETNLYSFPHPNKGLAPGLNLVFDKAGNMYGIASTLTCYGGCGLVFKLTPSKNGKWNYSVIHEFNDTDGDFPNGLTMDSQGDLFGTTSGGGKYGYGVVFEITP